MAIGRSCASRLLLFCRSTSLHRNKISQRSWQMLLCSDRWPDQTEAVHATATMSSSVTAMQQASRHMCMHFTPLLAMRQLRELSSSSNRSSTSSSGPATSPRQDGSPSSTSSSASPASPPEPPSNLDGRGLEAIPSPPKADASTTTTAALTAAAELAGGYARIQTAWAREAVRKS